MTLRKQSQIKHGGLVGTLRRQRQIML